MDIIIKNAKLLSKEYILDIAIEDGIIKDISKNMKYKSKEVIDAKGNLVSPPFIDPHIHLDAVLTAGDPRFNESGTLLEGIAIWGERKPSLTKEILKKNAKEAILWEVANGVEYIRTHVDTTDRTLVTAEALLEVKDEMKDVVDLQIVAFPQDGIFTYEENAGLMKKAMDMGLDVVGAIPHNELTREDGVLSVEFAFDLADKYNALVDIHCDETGDPNSRFIEIIAKETIKRGYGLRATASHTTSMHNFNNDYAFKLMGILRRSRMNVITNPFDNSVLQNRTDGYPRYRGHTRVDELDKNGVNVSIGHDSIMDPWYSMGKGSMLSAANLLMHTAHMSGYSQVFKLFDMITYNSAKTMNIENDYGIEKGKKANIIILDAKDPFEAIRLQSECLYVIRKGKVISKTIPAKREINFKGDIKNIDFKL